MFSYLRNTFSRSPSASDAGASRHAAAIALLAEPARTPEQERSVERLEARLFFDETLLAAASRIRPIARGSLVLGLLLGLMVSVTAPGIAAATAFSPGGGGSPQTEQASDPDQSPWDRLLEWIAEAAGLLGNEENPSEESEG